MSVAENFHEYSTRPENLDVSNIVRSKDKLMVILKSLTDSLKNAQNRDTLPNYIFPDMLSILARLSHNVFAKLKDDKNKLADKTVHMVELTTECYRSLRNACAGCKRNQEEVLRTPGLYRVTAGSVMTLVNSSKGSIAYPEVVQCLRCAVQFLGNAAAGFDESKTLVWESVFQSLRMLLVTEDTTLANYTCMLIYTCLTPNNLGDLMGTKDGAEVVAGVLNHFAKSETEWGEIINQRGNKSHEWVLYILEKLLANKSFLTKAYQFYPEKERSLLIGFIHKKLQVLEDKDGRNGQAKDTQNELRVENSNVTFISEEFKKNSAVILNLGKSEKDYQKPESQVVVNMLWALISATLSSQYRDQLQSDTELLKVTTNLLHSMTMIGKQGENAFSPASKIGQEGSVDKDNAVFGLKRDVVRFIGNLVYKHRANQDKIREMGGVQIIMECTTIDAKNPFMQQWAIFAIRNLCENNAENQELIGSSKLEGLADNQQLTDLGVEASVQNDKVSIKSTVKR